MGDESIRTALAEWSREELVEGWIGLNTLLEASAARREVAEACCAQLEEALRKYADRDNWVTDEFRGIDYWNIPLKEGEYAWDEARAALSRDPSEAPEEEE